MEPGKNKIVFVNQASGYLTIDIINAFAQHYEKTALISGSIRVQDIQLNSKVKCYKITRYNRGNPLQKLFSWLWGSIQIYFLLLTKFRKFEIFYITVPPTAYLLSLLLSNKFSVLVFDIYPDALKVFNIKEKNILYLKWNKWNIKLFKNAYRVYTLGEGMKQVLQKYVVPDKIQAINNWTGLVNANPIPKSDNWFIDKLNLRDKFIVEYSGNIGKTHNVEILLQVAQRLKEEQDIVFLIIGRGERFKLLHEKAVEEKLNNCIFLSFLPDGEILYSLSAADLSVVILDEKVADYSIPSKTYNLLAVGSAIMSISSEGTELSRFINERGVGRSFSQDEFDSMVAFIKELKDDPDRLKTYKENSLTISKEFTYKNAELYFEYYQ